jgi:hypothetical protein
MQSVDAPIGDEPVISIDRRNELKAADAASAERFPHGGATKAG